MKRMISAFAVLAIVGSALAFKPLNSGNIYCTTAGDQQGACTAQLIQYVEDANATTTNPCLTGTPHKTTVSGGITICEDRLNDTKFKEVFD